MSVHLTRGAADLLAEYMTHFRAARAHEWQEHGVDPLADPVHFFEDELKEPEHTLVLQAVEAKRGRVTPLIMALWIGENLTELEFARHGYLPEKHWKFNRGETRLHHKQCM
jgi:hypothetical protein